LGEIYAGAQFYRDTHNGTFDGGDADLERLLELASRKVDALTLGRIAARGFGGLTDFQKELVKRAVCRQADYFAEHGTEGGRDVASYSAAGVSVKFSGADPAAGAGFSRTGYELLEQSGLLWRGV
jgi:hypothetical protein